MLSPLVTASIASEFLQKVQVSFFCAGVVACLERSEAWGKVPASIHRVLGSGVRRSSTAAPTVGRCWDGRALWQARLGSRQEGERHLFQADNLRGPLPSKCGDTQE